MFELDNAIKNWRSGLLQNQNILESDADELENHVRDEVDSLMLAGLNAEEAFIVSTHRIGDQKTIDHEFAKVNPRVAWRRRAFWMFFGILVSMLVGGIAGICSTACAALMTWLNVNAYFSSVMASLVSIGVFFVILFIAVFGLSLFAKTLKGKLSVSIVLVLCVISIFIMKGLSIGFNIIRFRFLDAETIGEIALATAITNYAWAILWPIILGVLLFMLWSSRPQKVR